MSSNLLWPISKTQISSYLFIATCIFFSLFKSSGAILNEESQSIALNETNNDNQTSLNNNYSTINTNNELEPTVFIATLVRNKAHILPYFLTLLEQLDYPKDRISIW